MELKDLEIKKQELLAELKGVEEQIKEKSLIQLSDVPDGEEFSWCGYSWVKLGSEQDGVLCIASKIVYDMKFSKDNDADYKKSDIKKYLEGTFLKELNQDDMLDYLMDLMSDNGDKVLGTCKGKIGLITCDLYRKYYYQIPRYSDWWWTCTAWGYSSSAYGVRHVYADGSLYGSGADGSRGVVPACILKPSTKIRHDRGD